MKHFLAPRPDGTIGRYFGATINGIQCGIDDERAANVLESLSPQHRLRQSVVICLTAILFVGGFVALIWLPWYTPIVTIVFAYILFRINAASATNVIARVATDNPEAFQKLLELEVIRTVDSMHPRRMMANRVESYDQR